MRNSARGKNEISRRRLIAAYAVLAALGLALGAGFRAAGEEPRAFDDGEIQRAIERAVEHALENQKTETDGGAPDGGAPLVGFAPSPEPIEIANGGVDGGLPPWRRLPEPDAEGGAEQSVVVVPVEDVIDMGLAAFVRRAIEGHPDSAALILDIDTPGGRVDAATEIRDAIMDAPDSMRTVAFIHPRAISAGAFISLACDLIVIADGGSIGAATPISLSGGEAEPVDEKMVSYFRTEMASTARAKGRRGDIAEAMVDAEVEIPGISPAGKLLTLDTAGAIRWEIADAVANSLDEVLEKLALGGAERVDLELNWAEQLARLLTHPMLSGILMSIGVLGILIELYQPGFGLPGILGLACLVIFFAGHLVVHLAGWGEVAVFLIGVVLLFVELFVTTGFGVVGVLGVLMILGSLVFSLTALPVDVSFDTGLLNEAATRVLISLLAAVALFFAALAILPKTRVSHRLVLGDAIDATSAGGSEGAALAEVLSSGESGVAESALRPAGIARFGRRRVDVATEGEFVDRGEPVVIVRTSGNRVVVRRKS
ncbi:MAG: nodulation protein NfeD [Polyangia bacterium]